MYRFRYHTWILRDQQKMHPWKHPKHVKTTQAGGCKIEDWTTCLVMFLFLLGGHCSEESSLQPHVSQILLFIHPKIVRYLKWRLVNLRSPFFWGGGFSLLYVRYLYFRYLTCSVIHAGHVPMFHQVLLRCHLCNPMWGSAPQTPVPLLQCTSYMSRVTTALIGL